MAHFSRRNKAFEIKYTKNSLFRHYLKGLLVILLIPFIIFYIILFIFSLNATEDSFRYTSTEILSRGVTMLDNLFEVIYKNYESLSSDNTVQEFLFNNFFSEDAGHQTNISSAEISNQMNNICTSLNYLDSIHIYSRSNDYFLSNVNSGFTDMFYDNQCIDIYKNCQTSTCMVTRKHKDTNILTLCYIINKGFDNEGAIFFNIDIQKLTPTLLGSNEHDGVLILSNRIGETVMSSDNDFSRDISPALNSSYRTYDIIKSDDYVYMSTKLKHENANLVYCVTKHSYFTSFYPFGTNTTLYFVFTFLALLLLSVVGTFKLYNSISNAFAYIEMPSSDKNTYNEFVFLTENMMSRVKGSNDAEATLADKIQKLKKYQALALQTQINPHFLFNSLNLISSFALESENEDSPLVVIVDKLSDILRFCLNTKNYIIKTEEELNITKKYIEIENIKHDNSINFIFDIDDEIRSYYTLKMILQPIIENAITHGVKLLRHETGVVKISGKISGRNVIFSVTNNGPQIEPERLKLIQESLLSVADIPENNHIGLRNVNQRIKLIFGENYGCTIDSVDNNTVVTITIPIIEKIHDDFK